MMEPILTVYNLDGTLLNYQTLLRQCPHQVIDCTDIKGKNLYCAPNAFAEIKRRLLSAKKTPAALIGSGNYHYVTYLHLSRITHPFTLILFDHHTDLMENHDLLTCGSWLCQALRTIPYLKRAVIIGPDPKEFDKIPLDLQEKVTIFPENWSAKKIIHAFYSVCDTESIYISIDKDVLNEDDAKTNWDQGHMALNTILNCLNAWQILSWDGLDLCGEWPDPSFSQTSVQAAHLNEKANLAILKAAGLVKPNPKKVTIKSTAILRGKNKPSHSIGA